MQITRQRIYGSVRQPDEFRVLVDRLWPRGVSKEKADIDLWAKDIAPSAELRNWFGHKPERYDEFKERYVAEIAANPALPQLLATIKDQKELVLLYSAKDTEHNQAAVLQEYLLANI